jgi:hypothetical protein
LSQDIQGVLDGWEFEPEGLQVRVIAGDDGTEKIQMRFDLGLIQMQLDGRPDGQRPGGFLSLLDLFEAKARDAVAARTPFSLNTEDCAQLMREGLQYYHRYLSAFHLERYDLVERDTARNLRLFAFVARHATHQRDKLEFDQYRPYVQMMHTRARASQALRKGEHRAALKRIDEGIKAIRRFLAEYQQKDSAADCSSFELEDYEEAARLRDQIRRLQSIDST